MWLNSLQAIKKFCTQWPEALTDARSANWITIITSDYIHSGKRRVVYVAVIERKLRVIQFNLTKQTRNTLKKNAAHV